MNVDGTEGHPAGDSKVANDHHFEDIVIVLGYGSHEFAFLVVRKKARFAGFDSFDSDEVVGGVVDEHVREWRAVS